MDQTIVGSRAARPHYAKVVGMVAAAWIAISLLMPFFIGPMGMMASGWVALAGAQPWMVIALAVAFVGVLGSIYWLAPVCAVAMGVMLFQAYHRFASAIDGLAMEGDDAMMQGMVGAMAAQSGLGFGAFLVIFGVLLLLFSPLLRR